MRPVKGQLGARRRVDNWYISRSRPVGAWRACRTDGHGEYKWEEIGWERLGRGARGRGRPEGYGATKGYELATDVGKTDNERATRGTGIKQVYIAEAREG